MAYVRDALGVALAALVFGVGVGLTLPSVDAAILARVPPQFRGGALSLHNSVTFLGRSAGPVAFAGLAGATGYAPLFSGAGAVTLDCALVGRARRRPLNRRSGRSRAISVRSGRGAWAGQRR